MYFDRKFYLEQLVRADGNGMIKVITGIRRCGKSYLLFNIFRNYLLGKGVDSDHIISVNLEDSRNKSLRNPDELLKYIDNKLKDENKYYILLDEVQLVSEFEDVLNSYSEMSNVEVYVTGSNARFLSKDVITEFRGRVCEIRVRPLSFSEYYEVAGGDKREALETYYRYGGLPAVALLEKTEDKQNYLREIYETVYLRDVIERNGIKNDSDLKMLVRVLASSIGVSTNVKRITKTIKSVSSLDVSPNTILKYLEFLEDSFLLSAAQMCEVYGREYIDTETKYYFEDTGIRNVVLDFRQIEPTHITENVIYNELRKVGLSVDVGCVDVFERNSKNVLQRKKYEIDFVVNRHYERIYIQSAYALPTAEKMKRKQASLLRVHNVFLKIIIAADRYTSDFNEDGIYVLSLFDFLLGGEK